MKIKNEEELANILSMALSGYANRVARGEIKAFRGFLEGENTVEVKVSLESGSRLNVESLHPPIIEPIYTPEIATDTIIGTTTDEIMEDPVMAEPYNTQEEMSEFLETKKETTEEVIEKPKRNRKKK